MERLSPRLASSEQVKLQPSGAYAAKTLDGTVPSPAAARKMSGAELVAAGLIPEGASKEIQAKACASSGVRPTGSIIPGLKLAPKPARYSCTNSYPASALKT